MKTGQATVAAALVGALSLVASARLAAADSWSPLETKPLMAASFDIGSRHIVSSFVEANGRCKLTLMIREAEAPDSLVATVVDGRTGARRPLRRK